MPSEAAAVYARMSHVKGGESVEEQAEAGLADCAANGWAVYDLYAEKRSASRYETRERGEWARLLADLQAGSFTVVWLWESSRGDRKLTSWSRFLDTCRELKVSVRVHTHDRTYRPWIGRDWTTLADEGVRSATSSDEASRRVLRGIAGAARKGKPHGTGKYGYERHYDPQTGKLAAVTALPAEAAVVTEITGRAAAEPVLLITRDLNARGIPSPSGGTWHPSVVRGIALDRAYIGKRRHGTLEYDAIWPAIATPAQHQAAVARLSDPRRRSSHASAQKYLLSYLALCGTCGSPLQVKTPRPRQPSSIYKCAGPGGCVSCVREALDAYIREVIAGLHAASGGHVPGGADEAGAQAARDEAGQLQARLDEHAAASISARSLAIIEGKLLPLIRAAGQKAARLSAPPPPFDPRDGWDAPMWAQKAVVRAVLDTISGTIELHPAARAGRIAGGVPLDLRRVVIRGVQDGSEVVLRWRPDGG